MGPPVGQRSEKEERKPVGSPELLESDLGNDVHHFGIIELLGESIKSSPSLATALLHTRSHTGGGDCTSV